MKKLLFSLFLIHVFTYAIVAQEKLPCLRLNSIGAEFKLIPQEYTILPFDDMKSLLKNPDAFAPVDLSTYHIGSYYFSIKRDDQYIFKSPEGPLDANSIMNSARYGVNASFSMLNHKTNEYRKNREIILGLFYQPLFYHQSHNARTDTIVTDSIHFNYVYYDEYSPILGISGAYIFSSNPDKWISASAGIGLGVGTAIHPQVYETFGVMSGKVISDSTFSFPRYDFKILSNTQNIFAGKSSVLLEAKIPFRLNFKIAGGLGLYLLGELVASKQIYFNDGPSFTPKIHFASAIGLRYSFR